MTVVPQSRGRDVYKRYGKVISALKKAALLLPPKTRGALVHFNKNSDSKLSRLVRYIGIATLSAECGDLVDIRNQVDLFGVKKLIIGSRVSIHPKCYIDSTGGIDIGDDVSIAHHTTILSTNHAWTDPELPIRDQPVEHKRTRIHNDVWIGAGCRILGGVEIHSRSIVAAGAVVTKDVPPNSIVAGVPARVIQNF